MAKKKVLGYRVKIKDYNIPFYAKRDASRFGFSWLDAGDRGDILALPDAKTLRAVIRNFTFGWNPTWKDTLKIVKVVSRG